MTTEGSKAIIGRFYHLAFASNNKTAAKIAQQIIDK